ncbi:MAG: EAL domain-containing protein [Sedimenticola sp.]|nr:EAL domain-containing protein [Sedimenticola sp.]
MLKRTQKIRRYYHVTIPVALFCFWTVSTLHGFVAYGLVKPSTYVVPTLVALAVGTLVGYLFTLRKALQVTSEQFRAIADQAQEFVYLRRVDGVYDYVSPSCTEITGYSVDDFYRRPSLMDQLIYPEDLPLWQNHVHSVNEGGANDSFDIRLRTIDGRIKWINHICMPIYDEQGKQTGVRSTNLDITARKEGEDKLRQASTIFMHVSEGVVITDAEVKVLTVNQAFCDISGYTEDELLGKTPRTWRSQQQDDAFYQTMWNAINSKKQWRGEIINRRKNGDLYPAWLNISAVSDESGRIINYVSIVSDISNIKQSQERIEYLAHHDVLTGLPNRHLLNDRLEHAIQRAHRNKTRVATLFLDLDNFKSINEGLGHPVGDKVLKVAADRLDQVVREEDTVARIAGDEFSILLEDIVDTESVAILASKILAAYASPFSIDHHELHVSASIGISLFPDDGDDVTSLVKNADAAMHQAKEKGKGCYCFYTQALTSAALERLYLENQLRKALGQDEFQLFYQPQYALNTGKLIGAEALIRWNNKELGLVSPDRFIPLAESTGLILPIGEWVLYEACRQIKSWHDAGLNLPRMGVNVAGQQVQHGDIVATVKSVLEETGLEPMYLELEITESFIMRQAEEAISTLCALKELGVTLAIDDFGTGYSSLSYLKILPINKLKVDRSFVKDIPNDKNSEAIVRAVIVLGKSLQLEVIAEGVETEAQEAFLKSEACDEVQGFYYSRPVPADEFTKLLQLSMTSITEACAADQ